ncbi:MAG: hypothetical protein M0Z59_09115 [Nitrospiraceae bacterium]|nr:hypothetical protein [Nitrospiraceae bacterium]
MKPLARACVAYIAGRLICGTGVCSVFDCSQETELSQTNLDEGGVKISGLPSGRFLPASSSLNYKIRLNERGQNIDLSVKGDFFKGFDHESSCFFAGKVSGKKVYLYDYGELAHFQFRIMEGAKVF